jgi:SAM-dependent methyltransferase
MPDNRRAVDDDRLVSWLAALEARHLERLRFPEVRRALQALSSIYVERRSQLARGAALDSAGKRAAFALFYGPLHFLLVREIVRSTGVARPPLTRILDAGCGTGVGGAAWALEAGAGATVLGIDRSGWAVEEARFTFGALGVRGSARRGSIDRLRDGGTGDAVLASFVVNELDPGARERLGRELLEAGRRGARVLVVEPIARDVTPWWDEWARAFRDAGGDDAEWRVPVELPEQLRLLDRAAGLDHRELTARTLRLDRRI